MYLAMSAIYLGIALAANGPWTLIALAPTLAVMRYGVIAREERYMAARFGEAYLAYKASVRRWL